jgi:hypothetical protein
MMHMMIDLDCESRAAMIRAPATEHYCRRVGDRVNSCTVCMPIAGGFYQPLQLLLGVFPRTSTGDQVETLYLGGGSSTGSATLSRSGWPGQ